MSRGSPRPIAGLKADSKIVISFSSLRRSSPRTSASTTRSPTTTGIALDVAAGSMPRSSASASIVVTPGVSISSGASSRAGKLGRARDATGSLDVGEVVAVLAAHELVLARARRREEAERLRPAHDPGLRLDEVRLEAAALEHALVRLGVAVEARVEPRLVAVERVRVLHDELAHAEEPAARPRLVALLRREVVPGLRQLLCTSWISRAWKVIVSSCESGKTNCAPAPIRQLEDHREW